MIDYVRGSDPLTGITAASALRWDAERLRAAMLEAVRTSPDCFLMTEESVKARPPDSWIDEIRSSTWAVAQQKRQVVGVVAGKRPDPAKDVEDVAIARYIESLWIDPRLRGHGLAERLINYLMEAEYRRSHHVRHFLLWVFDTNLAAISLYKRMGFEQTPEINEGDRTEIKYHLDLESVVHADVGLAANEAARRQDGHQHGVTYRILGNPDLLKSRFSRSRRCQRITTIVLACPAR